MGSMLTTECSYSSRTMLSEILTLNFFVEDWEGVRNLISALPSSLKRIVLVSSVGVTKSNELPWR